MAKCYACKKLSKRLLQTNGNPLFYEFIKNLPTYNAVAKGMRICKREKWNYGGVECLGMV